MVQEPVQQRDGVGVLGEEGAPLVEGTVAAHAEAAALVGSSHEAEEQCLAHEDELEALESQESEDSADEGLAPGAQLHCKQGVAGSNPASPTNRGS